jgi:hypothetical protein
MGKAQSRCLNTFLETPHDVHTLQTSGAGRSCNLDVKWWHFTCTVPEEDDGCVLNAKALF